MSEVKKYFMQAGDGPGVYPMEDRDGDWVNTEDFEAIENECNHLRTALELQAREIENLKSAVLVSQRSAVNIAAELRAQLAAPAGVVLPSENAVMRVVLREMGASRHIRGTSNWCADVGMAVLNEVRRLNAAAPSPAPVSDVVPVPNYKRKFECLVEHAKRQDRVIAEMRYDENIRRFYDDGAVWFWAGDETDNLETLACPVVINAGDLRALLSGGRHE